MANNQMTHDQLAKKSPKFSWMYLGGTAVWGTAIALLGLAIAAEQTLAQSRCNNNQSNECGVVYYDTEQPVSLTPGGFVTTSTGIGLNVRSGPGLDYPVIGGAEDGIYIDLEGDSEVANGYRWRRVITGGWVATDYLAGGNAASTGLNANCSSGNVSYNNPCGQGGDVDPVRSVSYRGTRPNSQSNNRPVVNRPVVRGPGPYVVAIPGDNRTLLRQVRSVVPTARFDSARQGGFVNAGGFGDYEAAKSLTYLLRSRGLDARVIYR